MVTRPSRTLQSPSCSEHAELVAVCDLASGDVFWNGTCAVRARATFVREAIALDIRIVNVLQKIGLDVPDAVRNDALP